MLIPSAKSFLSLAAALWIIASSGVTLAGETAGTGRAMLTWRPVRPAAQANVRNAEQSVSPTTADAIANGQSVVRSARRAKRVDPQVKQVVLQLGDDPLANPFNDAIPRSPFRSSGMQPAPAEPVDPSAAPQLEPETAPTAAQPNPFETQPQDDAPDPMPADDDTAPPRNGPIPSPFLESEPGQKPDPKKDCERALRFLRANRLNLATSRAILDLAPGEKGELPYDCTFGSERRALNSGREWAQTVYTWKASGLCHKPLYFEQSHMERYGHSWGPLLDPVVSGAHFFATVPMLPYKMGLEPPCECIYPLGHYRPGNCAPHYIEPFPWSIRAAAAEAAAVTGLSFALP